MENDAQEAALAVAWDQHREMSDMTRGMLAGLLGGARSLAIRAKTKQLTEADWTRAEHTLLDFIELVAPAATAEELKRCLALMAIEASGKRVQIGMDDES